MEHEGSPISWFADSLSVPVDIKSFDECLYTSIGIRLTLDQITDVQPPLSDVYPADCRELNDKCLTSTASSTVMALSLSYIAVPWYRAFLGSLYFGQKPQRKVLQAFCRIPFMNGCHHLKPLRSLPWYTTTAPNLVSSQHIHLHTHVRRSTIIATGNY